MTAIDKTRLRSNELSNWMRRNLPDAKSGTLVTDVDFVVKNWRANDKMLFIEEKTNMGEVPAWQYKMIRDIVNCINLSGQMTAELIVITFENYNFQDGRVWLDGVESSEVEIKNYLKEYC